MQEAFKRSPLALSVLLYAVGAAAQSTAQTGIIESPYYVPLPQNRTQKAAAVIIVLDLDNPPFMACYYPISGNYCTLPRVLFYLTITAALLLRHYPWLRVGALAASLTYSGTAAIHASLIIWSRHAEGELDVVPLIAILSASCFVIVPLLTWSSTIRHAGKPKEEQLHQSEKYKRLLDRLTVQSLPSLSRMEGEDSIAQETFERRRKRLEARAKRRESGSDNIPGASRIILIMWACLVTVGFISTFVAIIDPTPDVRYGHWELFDFSLATEISCVPTNGTLDLSTGESTAYYAQFIISSDFLGKNNCIDPCPQNPTQNGRLWFREYSELQSPTESEIVTYESASGQTHLILNYAFHTSWICVFVLLQGIFAVCLGLNQPSEARIRMYGLITQVSSHFTKNDGQLKIWQTAIAKPVAFVTYLGAVCIAVISLPLLVLNVTLIEIYIQRLPQSETPRHIGAWSPYATIGLALFSFFIANIHLGRHLKLLWVNTIQGPSRVLNVLKRGKQKPKGGTSETDRHEWRKFGSRTRMNLIDYIVEKRDNVLDALQYEWTHTRDFWRDADGELTKYHQREQEVREQIEEVK